MAAQSTCAKDALLIRFVSKSECPLDYTDGPQGHPAARSPLPHLSPRYLVRPPFLINDTADCNNVQSG